MNPLVEARNVHRTFKAKPGSDHIAGLNTILAIIGFCQAEEPQKILELGGGIGTISHTLLQYSTATIDSYESNPWCLEQLRANVGYSDRLNLVTSYRQLPPHREYDLVVVDGGTGQGGDADDGTMKTVQLFLRSLDRVGTVIVEGDRTAQRGQIRRALKDEYLFRPERSPSTGEEKGFTIYRLKPAASKIRWLNWMLWEVIERSRG
jgi:hypothetical protein